MKNPYKKKTSVRKSVGSFLRLIRTAMSPEHYARLSNQPTRKSVRFFLKTFSVFFIIMIILLIPKLVSLPNEIEKNFNSFNKLDVSVNYSATKVIRVGEHLTVDLVNENSSSQGEDVFVDKQAITILKQSFPWKDFKDLRSMQTRNVLLVAFFISLPGLIIVAYIGLLLKMICIILGTSFVVLLLSLAIRKDLHYKKMLNVCFYSSIILITLEVVSLSLFEMHNLQAVIYLVFALFSVIFLSGVEKPLKKESI